MAVVIRLLRTFGGPHLFDGQYVVDYDPSPPDMEPGACLLVCSPDLARAKRYPDLEAAWGDWKRVDWRAPVRPDGKPNRPMTAFTIEVESVEGE
jgi:hypothetical protein